MKLPSLKNSIPALALGFGLAASQASAQTPPQSGQYNFPLRGVVLDRTVSSNVGNGTRNIKLDCGSLIGAVNSGKPVVVLTVAFISNFDTANSPEYLRTLSTATRQIIEESTKNYTPDESKVRTMIGHIEAAHGVKMSDVMEGAKACKSRLAPQ